MYTLMGRIISLKLRVLVALVEGHHLILIIYLVPHICLYLLFYGIYFFPLPYGCNKYTHIHTQKKMSKNKRYLK